MTVKKLLTLEEASKMLTLKVSRLRLAGQSDLQKMI